jgi:lipid-binding SYLF domain-containing protein
MRLPFVTALAVLSLAAPAARAASAEEIDARVRAAVVDLRQTSSAARELGGRARGMLVFPRVFKGGLGIGGAFGEGALLVGGETAAYYSVASASIGFQLGAQRQSVVILFMTDESLERFRTSRGWQAGVDGSVAFASIGGGETVDTETVRKPIVGFVFSNRGLMYDLALEGAKITRLKR